jgi:hypothetical protein
MKWWEETMLQMLSVVFAAVSLLTATAKAIALAIVTTGSTFACAIAGARLAVGRIVLAAARAA